MVSNLLPLVQCPICMANLDKKGDSSLVCVSCGKDYLLKDGIPVLLKEYLKL